MKIKTLFSNPDFIVKQLTINEHLYVIVQSESSYIFGSKCWTDNFFIYVDKQIKKKSEMTSSKRYFKIMLFYKNLFYGQK